jgi:hypothetical protein
LDFEELAFEELPFFAAPFALGGALPFVFKTGVIVSSLSSSSSS